MEQQPIRPFAALIFGGLLVVGNEYAAQHYRTFHASAYVLGIGCLLAGAVELIGRLFMRASRSDNAGLMIATLLLFVPVVGVVAALSLRLITFVG